MSLCTRWPRSSERSSRAKSATCGSPVTAATLLTAELKISFDHWAGSRSGIGSASSPLDARSAASSCTLAYGVAVRAHGPIQVAVSSSYSTWQSEWRIPLMKVTAEMIGHSP